MKSKILTSLSLCAIMLAGCNKQPGDAFRLDLEQLKTIDPAKITWRQTRVIRSPVTDPVAIAADGEFGHLYIAGTEEVVKIDSSWQELARTRLAAPAAALAAASDHKLFIAADRSVLLWESGTAERPKELGMMPAERASVCGIAVLGGRIFLADSDSKLIHTFESNGSTGISIGADRGAGERPHLILPSRIFDLAVDPRGTLWAVNPGTHSLENYRADGSFIGSWGEAGSTLSGFSGCCNPSHITLLPDGRFVTAEKGLTRVKEYDHQGNLLGVVCGPERLKDTGAGLDLAALADGRVAVLDPPASLIRIFEKKPQSTP